MNELNIYTRIKQQFDVSNKKINKMLWFSLYWAFYAIISAILTSHYLSVVWLNLIIIFVPFIPILTILIIRFFKHYELAKKYPIFYNKWKNQEDFVNTIRDRTSDRAQPDSETIKMKNNALEYIDELIKRYDDDKMKLANAFYNGVQNTNLVGEINFNEKFKKFKNDMGRYRNIV